MGRGETSLLSNPTGSELRPGRDKEKGKKQCEDNIYQVLYLIGDGWTIEEEKKKRKKKRGKKKEEKKKRKKKRGKKKRKKMQNENDIPTILG